MTREGAAARLHAVSLELRDALDSLAAAEIAERDARATRWEEGSDGLGVTEFRWEIDYSEMTHMAAREVVEARARVAILEEERSHLMFLLKYGLEGVIGGEHPGS